MADFHAAFNSVLDSEGGWKDHTVAGDRGGRTFAGISERAHPDSSLWRRLDEYGPDSEIVRATVRAIYKREYWDRLDFNERGHQHLAEAAYALAVHSGTKVALHILRESGSDVNRFAVLTIARYLRIVDKNPSQRKFLRGWVRRALKFAGV